MIFEVARDGRPRNLLALPAPRTVVLKTLLDLGTKVDLTRSNFPPSPVFRRITPHRFEVWTSLNGWLFNERGELLAHVTVPRRDGSGRDWFGAFLDDLRRCP